MKRPPRKTYPRCACSKVACDGIDEARATHAEIWAARGGQTEVRFYPCPHGSWHWTRALDPMPYQQKAAA